MAEAFGRYQLLKRIAGGGMGEVYLARQTGIEGFQKLLVIKTLLPHLTEDTEFVTMFLDEARLAARLAHPNVIQIFDLGQENGVYYIAMEYVYGEDLKSLWKQAYKMKEVIPTPLACRIISDAAAGLGYAHRLANEKGEPFNLVHRDVSPQNLLISFDGGVKLVDFGVAKAAGQASKTQTGALKGKYAYMSPEQVDGQPIDRRSDIFALGILLWEMATGQRLFRADSDVATLKAVAKCEVPPPSVANPAVPRELEPIILKALARDREQRYQTMEEFRLALEEYLTRAQLSASTAHLAELMHHLFAERLAHDGSLGPMSDVDPNATGFGPASGAPPRSEGSGSTARDLVRPQVAGQSGAPPRMSPWAIVGVSAFAAAGIGLVAWQAALRDHAERADATGFHPVDTILTIQTTPSEAEVFADGASLGFTPLLDLRMAPGRTVHLEIKKAGFQSVTRDLTLTPRVERLDINLISEAAPHVIMHLESDPAGAAVTLGNQQLGTTPFDWDVTGSSAPATLTFKLAGYKPSELQVTRGKESRASAKLVRVPKPVAEKPPLEIKQGR